MIGSLLIFGAIGVMVPYTILTTTFNYPDVLRQESGTVLQSFHAGGPSLILSWLAFAMLGLPLIPAYILIGRKLQGGLVLVATTFGIVSGFAQVIGLLRWVFIVPIIASQYVDSSDQHTRDALVVSFGLIHQLGGVLLGEFLGQFTTVVWTALISTAFIRTNYFPKWLGWLGIFASSIYVLAGAESIATVIPNFPNWQAAGFIGSTLWLVWLFITGVMFFLKKEKVSAV